MIKSDTVFSNTPPTGSGKPVHLGLKARWNHRYITLFYLLVISTLADCTNSRSFSRLLLRKILQTTNDTMAAMVATGTTTTMATNAASSKPSPFYRIRVTTALTELSQVESGLITTE